MKNREQIAEYLSGKPKIKKVYVHKTTGEYHVTQPTVERVETVKQNNKDKKVVHYDADKNYEAFTREEILSDSGSGTTVSPYAKLKEKELIAICEERKYPKEEYQGKKVGELRTYLDGKDAESAQ